MDWGWYVGLIPIFAYLLVLVLCYLVARSMDQWWLWYLVWGFAALGACGYLVGRLHHVYLTYHQDVPVDPVRIIAVSIGAFSFLGELMCAYLIFRRGRRRPPP
jgi:hypothetical protein